MIDILEEYVLKHKNDVVNVCYWFIVIELNYFHAIY